MQAINIFWFRRDLRLNDNAGLFYALKDENPVLPVFIFDRKILDELEDKKDRRVTFIYKAILEIQNALLKQGSTLQVCYGFPEEVFNNLLSEYNIQKVFANHDFEPYAIERDLTLQNILKEKNIEFHTYKDQVIFEKDEVLS